MSYQIIKKENGLSYLEEFVIEVFETMTSLEKNTINIFSLESKCMVFKKEIALGKEF